MWASSSGPSTGQTCGLVLIFAVLLQTICVAVTFLYFTNELQQLRETYSKNSFTCFTKENFFLEDLDPNYREDDDPCWQVKWQLTRFIKKVLIRNRAKGAFFSGKGGVSLDSYAAEREATENRTPRAAAHLTANRERKSPISTQNSSFRSSFGFKINAWDSSRGNAFLQSLQLRNGELIVPYTGFYYIYSQTYFWFREPEGLEPDSDPGSDSVRNPKQMVQYVSKYTDYPDPIPLMKSARTSCWSKKTEYGLYSIYQGGVFHLKSNDRIFVSVSNEDLVVLDKEASYFGAFQVA